MRVEAEPPLEARGTEPDTVWRAGRLDGKRGPKAVLFGRTYEDPRIELAAFGSSTRVMCIASAGCTPRALCGRHEVVAVDINPVQLDYAQRQLAGEPPALGKAERVMAAARTFMPLMGLHRRALSDFLDMTDPAEQVERFRQLCTARFRLGLDALFSFTGLRAVYASPLLELLPERFGRVLLSRFERCFATHPNRDNPYARALFMGGLPLASGPAKGPVEWVCEDAASYLEAQPAGSFGGLGLSNILDGAAPGYRARLFAAVRHAASPDAKVVLRSFGEPSEGTAGNQAARDRSMLWGVVQVCSPDQLPL